jgi:hypothetical protein
LPTVAGAGFGAVAFSGNGPGDGIVPMFEEEVDEQIDDDGAEEATDRPAARTNPDAASDRLEKEEEEEE